MAIRGDTTAGAAAGSLAAIHIQALYPAPPTGSDTKSSTIVGRVMSNLETARKESETYNVSVDTLRTAFTEAPRGVDRTDEAGAAHVAASGEVQPS